MEGKAQHFCLLLHRKAVIASIKTRTLMKTFFNTVLNQFLINVTDKW